MPCDELLKKKTVKEIQDILTDVEQRIQAERDPVRKQRLIEYLDHLRMHAEEAKAANDPPLPPPPNPFKKVKEVAA